MPTLIIGLLVASIVIWAAISTIRSRKGGGCEGCSGGCHSHSCKEQH